jgi:hypothetical protein
MEMSQAVVHEAVGLGSAGTLGGRARPSVLAARDARRGLSFADHMTLVLIGLVVVLVSLPRLRRFALRENETDAARMLRVLWTESEAQGVSLHPGILGALFGPGTGLQNRSEDVEVLEDGRLRRHGYLFDVVESPAGEANIAAWPWEYGRTGLGAFSISASRGVIANENASGLMSGPLRAPDGMELAAARGWRALPRF